MTRIFVNLKRFDVPRSLGGVCPEEDPERWIRGVLRRTFDNGLSKGRHAKIIFLVPESLILIAQQELRAHPVSERSAISIGCQGVFRRNVQVGGNFGAFTTNLPAAAAAAMGVAWTIVGHSEERADKLDILRSYDPDVEKTEPLRIRARETVDRHINQEVLRALESGIDVLLCVGETAEERGDGSFEDQKPRIERALQSQIEIGLDGARKFLSSREIVIGYEPVWAIGPGKTPPGADYVSFVAEYIKRIAGRIHGFEPSVVYGGGLKEENAALLGGVKEIGGGLVALTRFSPPIGFDPDELAIIVEKYAQGGTK